MTIPGIKDFQFAEPWWLLLLRMLRVTTITTTMTIIVGLSLKICLAKRGESRNGCSGWRATTTKKKS